ncbi:hypothetical protein [Paraburkholderia sp. MM6662-R1]|uniref:hypothetical protein n=1 Tax=Paraburkholderia sp. MM6662-R1 TaxID=2991066 RepID=UPI003D1FC0E3
MAGRENDRFFAAGVRRARASGVCSLSRCAEQRVDPSISQPLSDMNEAERKKRLETLIEHQAAWIEMVARQQARLELYSDGRLPVSNEKIELIAKGQRELIVAARNINDAILGTVKSAETQQTEVDSFLADLDRREVRFADRAGWRAAVLASDDWRRAAAENGRTRAISMHWGEPGVSTMEVLLTLVELLDRHGFTPGERRDVLTHVRTSSSH